MKKRGRGPKKASLVPTGDRRFSLFGEAKRRREKKRECEARGKEGKGEGSQF